MKMYLFVTLLLLIALSALCIETSSVYCQTNQLTLKPTDDTFTNSQNRNSNYGGQTHLEVECYQINLSQPINYQSIIFLKFNLSSIPIGAVIDTATLQLYTTYVSETYNIAVCYISNNSWTELGLTRNNLDSLNPDLFFTSLYEIAVGTNSQWYGWNVTDALNSAKIDNNLSSVTLVLITDTFYSAYSNVWFASKEYPVVLTDYSPRLTVHWSAIVPEFQEVVLLPFFMIVTLLIVVFYRKQNKSLKPSCQHSNGRKS